MGDVIAPARRYLNLPQPLWSAGVLGSLTDEVKASQYMIYVYDLTRVFERAQLMGKDYLCR